MLYIYRCDICNNILAFKEAQETAPICCGEPMKLLTAHDLDETNEKHVPVINVNNTEVEVKIGSVPHPMSEAHLIEAVILETDKRILIKHLTPSDLPQAQFELEDDETVIAAYDFCNIHGLWVKNA